jgi:hypothetical protein
MIARRRIPQFPDFLGRPNGGKRHLYAGSGAVGSQNKPVDLARVGWLVTVLGCLIAVLILVLQGYLGYAGVTFAVAVAAAINLF